MKTCSRCKIEKSSESFSKSASCSQGLQNYCKLCARIKSLESERSKHGLLRRLWHSQKATSKRRGDDPPAYTVKELIQWGLDQQLYHTLHNNWVLSGYEKMQSPSIDRLDDYKGYTLDNIQLMTWESNNNKYKEDIKEGVNTKVCKAVIATDIVTGAVSEFYSLAEAARQIRGNSKYTGDICTCLKGGQLTAYGHTWEYASPR